MSKFIVVWNEGKNEGVIFTQDSRQDAQHARGNRITNPCSSLADSFNDLYGDETRTSQLVEINETLAK